MCDSKLVQTYDFEYIGLLDKITVRLFILSAIVWVIASFVWGQTVGVIVFGVPAAIGGVTHAMYWSVIANIEEKEIQETRVLENA